MHTPKLTKNNIALLIALLFHVCGAIGILFSPYRQWFINNTPVMLITIALLLVITQRAKNRWFYTFVVVVFIAGITVEVIGVHTSRLFGQYSYGNVLGAKINGVPWMVGINWFIIIYCSGVITYQLDEWVQKKLTGDVKLSSGMQWIAFITDAALLSTFFDWVIEPVAVKMGFWHWQNNIVPLYNYASWFIISALLLAVFRLLPFIKRNQFAVHLFIIQLLFFFMLQTFL